MKFAVLYTKSEGFRSLPPCGGSGLKSFLMLLMELSTLSSPSLRREWIEIGHKAGSPSYLGQSPSLRREWIEIVFWASQNFGDAVSLLAEGVD